MRDSMATTVSGQRAIRTTEDIVAVRQAVRARAVELGFNLVDQTKIVTAASELARNTVQYGGGGVVQIDALTGPGMQGIRLILEDCGPGIADIEQAMTDGFSSGGGLGLGLSGARRLSSEFSIESRPGEGTRVTIVRWR